MLAFDTETALIEEFVPAPELVCVSFDDGTLLNAEEGAARMEELLNGNEVLIGHNTPFDVSVLCARDCRLVPVCARAYRDGRLRDTRTREQQLDYVAGTLQSHRYALKDLARRRLGRTLKKDQWRLGYEGLRNLPIASWPEGARNYAILDAKTTREVFDSQGEDLPNEREHAFGSWVLYLMFKPELRGKLVLSNPWTFGHKFVSLFEDIRAELMGRGIQDDITSLMSPKFAGFVYRVRFNVGKEAMTWSW